MTPEQEAAFDEEIDRQWRQLEADLFLVTRLVHGPLPYQYLVQTAAEEGIPQSRLYKARKRLGVYSIPGGWREQSCWALPGEGVSVP
jgi:hypothetical protein